MRAAPAIDPLKLTSGIRRTVTGFPVIAEVVAPGVRPVRDGTDPAARRSVRAGISVTGQVTAGANPRPAADRPPDAATPAEGRALGVGRGGKPGAPDAGPEPPAKAGPATEPTPETAVPDAPDRVAGPHPGAVPDPATDPPRRADDREETAPQLVSVPVSAGYHHSGGRTGRSARAGTIGTGPASRRRIRGA